ncbi:hypothetical protein BASA81_016554 [Batrachochytrium salamandrivorans]|nr:hypothetical protein BASA81_016554 [Batrachochytrium salamandrivorans]
MQIQVTSHETLGDGVVMFSLIATSPAASTTSKKRYSDFESLNDKLRANKQPTLALPGKLWIHSESNLRERRIALERALRNYLDKRGTNKVLDQFLGVDKAAASSPSVSAEAGGQERQQPTAATAVDIPKTTMTPSSLIKSSPKHSLPSAPLPLLPVAAGVVALVVANQARKQSGSNLVGFLTLAVGSVLASIALPEQ